LGCEFEDFCGSRLIWVVIVLIIVGRVVILVVSYVIRGGFGLWFYCFLCFRIVFGCDLNNVCDLRLIWVVIVAIHVIVGCGFGNMFQLSGLILFIYFYPFVEF